MKSPRLNRTPALRLLTIALAGLAAVSGCSNPGPPAEWSVSADTVAGRITVTNTPPASGPRPTVSAVEELRIGTVDAGGPAAFGMIRSIAILDDGRIAVGDAQAEEVRVFDAEGRHLRTFGGEGGGPGELDGMQGVYLDRDGLLRVPEQVNARMSIFDPDTGFLRSHPFRMFSHGFRGPWAAAFDSAGRTLVASSGQFGEGRYWNMLRIYDSEMVQLDSIPYYDYTDDDSEDYPGSWDIPMGRGTLHVQVPFYPAPQETLSTEGVFWTSRWGAERLEVVRWTPPGDTTLVILSQRVPDPVTNTQRDSAMAEITDRLSARSTDSPRLDPSRIPSTHPPTTGLSLDDRGRLWVRLSRPNANPTLYDVFTPDGVHAETVSLPFAVDVAIPPVIQGETVWAVVLDELQVQHIVRGGLKWGAAFISGAGRR